MKNRKLPANSGNVISNTNNNKHWDEVEGVLGIYKGPVWAWKSFHPFLRKWHLN